jgi:polysaccharide pyruvyl transferase WcaK-like protein
MFCLVNAAGSTLGDDAISNVIKLWMQEFGAECRHFIPPPCELDRHAGFSQTKGLILGGAGIIYDDPKQNYWHTNHYTGYIEWAKKRGIKACGISLGWQGVITDYGKKKWRDALNYLDFITTREAHTKAYLEGIGVRTEIIPLQDIAVCYPLDPKLKASSDIAVGLHHPIVTCNDFKNKEYWTLEGLYKSFFGNLSRYSMNFYAFSLCHGLKAYRDFLPPKSNLIHQSASITQSMMAGAKIAVTTNLHGLVFAVAACLPVYALYLGPKNMKINWFIQDLELPCYDHVLNINSKRVYALMEKPYDPKPYKEKAVKVALQNRELLRKWVR